MAKLNSLGISTAKSSVRTVGASLGASFWSQVQLGIIISFILMGFVVFIMFRTFVPSLAVIIAAVSDIIETLAFMQIFGINMSFASFAALLMLIGYSVDTDILQTTRVLKDQAPLKDKVRRGLGTGLTMTFTTIGALTVLVISSINPVLTEIASVLLIGLVFDMINTWIQNTGILVFYAEKKGL